MIALCYRKTKQKTSFIEFLRREPINAWRSRAVVRDKGSGKLDAGGTGPRRNNGLGEEDHERVVDRCGEEEADQPGVVIKGVEARDEEADERDTNTGDEGGGSAEAAYLGVMEFAGEFSFESWTM